MQSKVGAVVEVILVFVLLEVAWMFGARTPLARWESQNLHWDYLGAISVIVTALLMIIFPKRDMKTYGLSLTNLRYNLVLGGSFFAVLIGVSILANLASLRLNPKYEGYVASTLIFLFFFVGFGEELFFRGYLQSRLNEALGRPFHLWGINFGVGLIIASLLFAFGHVLNPFNPFAGKYALDWGWGLGTLMGGFLLGLMREKTGSILAAGIIHGSTDITFLIKFNLASNITLLLAVVLFWLYAIPLSDRIKRGGKS